MQVAARGRKRGFQILRQRLVDLDALPRHRMVESDTPEVVEATPLMAAVEGPAPLLSGVPNEESVAPPFIEAETPDVDGPTPPAVKAVTTNC